MDLKKKLNKLKTLKKVGINYFQNRFKIGSNRNPKKVNE
jgi:hypothetical protein